MFRTAHETLALLPAPVRRSLLGRVPEPLFFTGQVVNWNDGDHFTLDLLRLDRATAVAVRARTHRDATVWQLHQAVYEFLGYARTGRSGEHGALHP